MIRVTKEMGQVVDLAQNPLLASFLGPMFAGSKFHRAVPHRAPQYSSIKSEAFEQLDKANQQHVEAALHHYAQRHHCSISDLAWAIAPQQCNGIHLVRIKKCEDIERQHWEEKHGP